jgi:hypothetical protein
LGNYTSTTSLLATIIDENQFHEFRRKLLGQPTPRQSQIEASITQSKQYNEENYLNTNTTSSTTKHQKVRKKSEDSVIIHFTHENRFIDIKRDMHEVFREAFQALGIEAVHLIVAHRDSQTSHRERPHIKHMTLKNKAKP